MKYSKFLVKSIEYEVGNNNFIKYLPIEFDLDSADYSKNSYFKQYGFNVPNYIKDVYSQCSGIESDKYIPTDLYYFYIIPYLNNLKQAPAIFDKNNYDIIFQGVNMPKCIIKKQNGYIYRERTEYKNLITYDQAVNILKTHSEFIIKPSIDSGCGKGVMRVKCEGLHDNQLKELLEDYTADFIVQEIVQQHEILNRLNKTSLNTMRIVTYRRGFNDFVHLGTVLRFGREGTYLDNACAGGRNLRILSNGKADRIVRSSRTFKQENLDDIFGVDELVIPNYDKVLDFCYQLHARVPYLNFCGWDITIDCKGKPLLIELNNYPDCELIQTNCGPLFGEYTDEIMEKVSGFTVEWKAGVRKVFKDGHEDETIYCDLK